jgi:hypothetical protein
MCNLRGARGWAIAPQYFFLPKKIFFPTEFDGHVKKWAEGVGKGRIYEACSESKNTSRVGRWGNFLCLFSNTGVDLDPLPVSHSRLAVVEPALFE